MKIINFTTVAMVAALSCVGTFAQDFDDFGDFGNINNSTISGAINSVSINGQAKIESRGYLDTNSNKNGINRENGIKDINTTSNPSANLNFKYSGTTVETEVKLKFDNNTLGKNKNAILDEAIIRGIFMDNALTLEAGKMKTIWGKGDRLHVIDNFNSDDYSDFIIPLYSDRRIAIPMIKASYAIAKNNIVIEGIWTPGMQADTFMTDGRWTPAKVKNLKNEVTKVMTNKYNAATNDEKFEKLAEANKYNSDQTALYPDTNSLKYNQAGMRLTGTIGKLDLGASYYYGHYKQVSANPKKYITSQSTELPELDFDRKQTFGLEAATVLWKLNLRSELCYNLTEDVKGDNPWIHNNNIQWLAGFDIDLPISNINVNIQETGTYILNNNKIKNKDGIKKEIPAAYISADPEILTVDVDYDAKDRYTTNHLVVNITDSWKNGKIEPEVLTLWSIERGDLVILPKVSFKPNQDITFTVNGLFMYAKNDNSEFAEWSGKGNGSLNNSYIGCGVKCSF